MARKKNSRWLQKASARMKKKGTQGAFTQWCKSRGYKGVTGACIAEGLRSKNPTTRKRANFARNVRRISRRR